MLEGSILQRLALARETGPKNQAPFSYGVYYKNTLVALCHALEDSILQAKTAPLVITAFQQGKWYLQEADRYGDLAERSHQVVIMAAPDTGFADHPTSQRPNVALVPLETTDPVAQEWHLMIYSPTYTAMVLCQELSEADYGPEGLPTEDRERKFYGFWTFEPALVAQTMELAIAHIGRYNPELEAHLASQLQTIKAAAAQTQETEDFGAIVARVVDYLQAYQQDLSLQMRELASSHRSALDHNLVSNEVQAFLRMAQLVDQADAANPMAAAEVGAIAEMMGQLLDLPAWRLKHLRLAGLLHRIAPLQGMDSLLVATGEETEAAPCCPLVPGAQILRTMPRLRVVAEIITHQTEWWQGQGQPAGLAGEEIPIESRILGLVAHFQQRVVAHRAQQQAAEAAAESPFALALADCRAQQGERWDPKLVETLALLAHGFQQGLGLSTSPPRLTSSFWLLDADAKQEAIAGQTANFYTTGQRYES